MWIVWLLLGLSAWIVLLPASAAPWSWVPAAQASPDEAHAMNLHWLVHQQGVFAASHSRLLYYPTGMNWLAACGIPLDALASWPLLALAGWPAGFTLFLVLLIWGAGAAMAWLAGCWWRSAGAGLVAGVAYQCSGILLWEVAGGRTANLLGAIFIPLALGLLARGLLANRWQDGLLAGVMTGLAVIPYWFNGLYLALGFLVLLLLALLEWRLPWRVYLAGIGGTLALVGLPAAYAWSTLESVPGIHMTAADMIYRFQFSGAAALQGGGGTAQAQERTLLSWIQSSNSLFGADSPPGLGLVFPLLAGLVLAGVVGQRLRRWVAPLAWAALGGLVAMGPWIQLPAGGPALPGPYLAALDLPLLRRFWWPHQALLLAAPGLCLLAGGGAAAVLRQLSPGGRLSRVLRRLRSRSNPQHLTSPGRANVPLWGSLLVAAALLLEAFLVLPQLPMPTRNNEQSAAVQALKKGRGPLLILPFGGGPLRPHRQLLLDQIRHGRPLVNGHLFPHKALAPRSYTRSPIWAAVRYLSLCEVASSRRPSWDNLAAARAGLTRVGLREVHVEFSAVRASTADKVRYFNCLERLLGTTYKQDPPFRVYHLADTRPGT